MPVNIWKIAPTKYQYNRVQKHDEESDFSKLQKRSKQPLG